MSTGLNAWPYQRGRVRAASHRTVEDRLSCAAAFLYLASPTLGGYVTGQILEVNGGQLMP